MLIFCTTWLGVGLSLKNVEQTSSKKEVIDIMCFVKGNNFTVHNFLKGQVISDVFWLIMYQIIKKQCVKMDILKQFHSIVSV